MRFQNCFKRQWILLEIMLALVVTVEAQDLDQAAHERKIGDVGAEYVAQRQIAAVLAQGPANTGGYLRRRGPHRNDGQANDQRGDTEQHRKPDGTGDQHVGTFPEYYEAYDQQFNS